jgi:hypothetical protein
MNIASESFIAILSLVFEGGVGVGRRFGPFFSLG